MTIRERIRLDFCVDLPIKGGTGSSITSPVIVERTKTNDYTGTEYAYLKYLGIGRRISWKTLKQELLIHEGRRIDKIKIETTEVTKTEIIKQVENFYFDITDCLERRKEIF